MEFLTTVEMANHLRLKPETILRMAREGKIPAVRISPKVIRFDPQAVVDALIGKAVRHGR